MLQTQQTQTVFLNDFSGDVMARLHAAGDYLREHPGTTLIIEAGEYIIGDKRARQIREDVFNGVYGFNPQPTMFSPHFSYTKGLDLTNCQDVRIEAWGAVFLIDGYMEPITISHAKNVTLCGLTIDHLVKPFCRAWVEEVEDGGVGILRFDPHTPPRLSMSAPRIMTFHGKTGYLSGRFHGWDAKKEALDETGLRYRLHGGFLSEEVGDELYFCTTYHFRPAVLISHSENTCLQDVTIHNHPGMGITGFASHDICLRGLHIVPSPGYRVSTNTDATHFASCSGTIRVEHSVFIGHGDDAINVHNYYYYFLPTSAPEYPGQLDETCAVIHVVTPDGTHTQEPDVPQVGHVLRLLDKRTLALIDTYTVCQTECLNEAGDICRVTLDHALPQGDTAHYMFENDSQVAALSFCYNRVSNHLARSVLCKTRHALIANNFFDRCTGSAVHIAAEPNWGEALATEDVSVENNVFQNCGFCSYGRTYGASAVSVNVAAESPTAVGLHRHIVIRDNTVQCPPDASCAFFVSNAADVSVQNNQCTGCDFDLLVQYSEEVKTDCKTQYIDN
ncbi:MAG: hypothetical protein KHW87_04440 [Clostridiales bacterium]|nr:hypothetical protein [Clostridiales bacterium]